MTDRRARIEKCADARFDVVAEVGTDFQKTGVNNPAADPHGYGAVVRAEVARKGPRAEVHPLAHVGVPEETFVGLVAVSLHDGHLDFAANSALRTEAGFLGARRQQMA